MQLDDFDFDLPAERIAAHPTTERRASRLLHLRATGEVSDTAFDQLPSLLRAGDLLVFNDTRVIKARLRGRKATGGKIEVLVERVLGEREALAQVKASKAPKPEMLLSFREGCTATVLDRTDDLFRLRFDTPIDTYLERHGEVPLPPYLGRDAESADDERYQTVYAKTDGAVAAPTAGLHFDEPMIRQTAAMGVRHCFITLHVGAGTFQPLRHQHVSRNHLHAERVVVDQSVCEAVSATRATGGRVVAVGTTSVRALETAVAHGALQPYTGETDLFIVPGYRFRAVDAMLTNFHLPRSSLLMLVSAFAGRERVLGAYRHAVCENYRFFSYGDAMFLDTPTDGGR